MRSLSRPGRLVAVATIAVFVAACSSSGAGGGGGDQQNGPSQSVAAPTEPTEILNVPTLPPLASTASGVTVQVKKGAMGSYLTDGSGMSLYVRTTDSANKTTCTGACATAWPPLLLKAGDTVSAGAGVTGKLASFARPDGSTQVTLNGMPLYYFSGDTSAGDTNGQGVQGIWFLAAPAGGHLGGGAKPAASAAAGW